MPETARPASPPGEEELRFIRNFHDVFLSIGLAMFAAGLGIVSSLLIGRYTDGLEGEQWRQVTVFMAAISFIDAAIMWALAEVFARTRRLFLPAIVILIAFLFFLTGGLSSVYAFLFLKQDLGSFDHALSELRSLPLFISLGATLGTFAYYLRMKLPFAMGVGALAFACAVASAIYWRAPEWAEAHQFSLFLGAGLFLFALGVAFDARDPARLTRFSDNGFWLHFFAAPIIFSAVSLKVTGGNGVIGGLVAEGIGEGDALPAAVATLAVVFVFALISLLINRRALLVSGLISAAIAIGVVVSKAGLDGAWTAAVTLLLLGGAMVLLGGGWHAVRRVLTAPFPKSGPISRIIPPEPPAETRAARVAE